MENVYQADLIFDQELTPKAGKIPFGIHTNCKLTGVDKVDEHYDINFEDSTGRTHHLRLFKPNGKYPKRDKITNLEIETTEEAIAREERERMRHLVKLLHIFIGKENLSKIVAKSYDQFMSKAAAILNQKKEAKKLNLKLIYDSEGVYSEFGKIPDYVEEYVEGEEPKLEYTPWELNNRCKKKDATPSIDYGSLS